MHTENSISINALPETVYRFAAAVERWPDLLPHYRWVTVLRDDGAQRLVEMAAHRDGIPVRWQAIQELFPLEPRITFRHVRGVTAGMEVEWHFEPQPDGVRVLIRHDLVLAWPLIGPAVAEHIIGPFFIHNIAGKTLGRIKELAERAEHAPAQSGASS